jgi:hypothetical protein
MISERVAMVRREYDDGVLQISALVQRIQDLTHLLVDHCHVGSIVPAKSQQIVR